MIRDVFYNWLEGDAAKRLAIPLVIGKWKDEYLEFAFTGITPAISVTLDAWNLCVQVEWEGTNWDVILDLDTEPQSVDGGVVCGWCEPEDRIIFPSEVELWRDHLFEPFLAWVNDELATADLLCLYGERDHMTWAKLEKCKGVYREFPVAGIPVRVR